MPTFPGQQSLDELRDDARALLRGAVDVHVHAGPDPFAERPFDARQLAEQYRAAGLGGFVLKSHEYCTEPLVWALRPEFPSMRLYGAMALDHSVGGLNPDALEVALRIGTQVVWMPTFDARWSRERYGRWHARGEGISVLDGQGDLLPVCHELIELLREHDATLSTGHLSPEETLALVRAARGRGVRTVVTHATWFGITREVQQAAAALGAYIEQCANSTLREGEEEAFGPIRDDVRAVGAEHVILSTDLGQPTNPLPTLGFGIWIEKFLADGFTQDEVRRMVQENPSSALD